MLNDFLALFLGAYDALIGRDFPEWYLVRAVLALLVLFAVLVFSLWCILTVFRAQNLWRKSRSVIRVMVRTRPS